MTKLWHVWLGSETKASKLEKQFRADLANFHSIIAIGYSLSVDVREMTNKELREQLKKDNPYDKKYSATIEQYERAITIQLGLINNFRNNIEKNDYVISAFTNSSRQYRIGQITDQIGTIGSLLGSPMKSFSQNYKHASDADKTDTYGNPFDPMRQSNSLARKVIWLTDLFVQDDFKDKIKGQLTGTPPKTRGTVTKLEALKNMPDSMVKNSNLILANQNR